MDLNREELSEKIAGLIRSEKEGKTWDFKRQWYEDKGKWVKHILAMANNETSEDSYIIIGVAEDSSEHRAERFVPTNHIEKDYKLEEDRKENGFEQQSELTKWLRELPFADKCPDLDLELGVWVSSLQCLVDLIIVRSTSDCPYYLSEDYPKRKCDKNKPNSIETEDIKQLICKENKKIDAQCIERINYSPKSKTKLRSIDAKNIEKLILKREPTESEVIRANDVYTRIKDMSAHTFNEGLAGFGELEKLYRKRFGLSLSIEDRFKLLLSNKDDWGLMSYKQPFIFPPVEKSYIVHKYCPDFFMEIELTNNPSFGRHELFPTFCCDWCNATSSLFFGVLRLLYGKFLVDKFWIVFIDGLCFVEPSHVQIPQCLDKTMKFYGFFYFIENDVKFNINNILKKVCAHQKYLRSKWVPVNPPEDAFIEDDGWCRSRVKNDIKKDVYSIHEYMKKYIIYFKDEEEKTKYQDYLVNNKEAIRNYLENLNLNDNIFRENLSRNFNKGMDIDKINRIVELHCIRKFFVKNFYEWKISRCLSKVTFGCLADYLCAFFCDNVRFNIVPRCREDFNCHLPDFIAYFHNEIESGLIFRYEYDECTVDYRTEIKKNFFSSRSFEFKGVTVSIGDCEYSIGLICPNENDGPGKFCYFYFFEDSVECKINDIIFQRCLTSIEVDDKIKGRRRECDEIFKNCFVYFKNEEEKQEFDVYLQENQKDILKEIKSFYEKNRQKFEKDCRKICPKEFSSKVEIMVERGARAEKIAEFFCRWKDGKNNDNQGDLTSLVEDGAREVICLKGQK